MTLSLDLSLLPREQQKIVGDFCDLAYDVLPEKSKVYLDRYGVYVDFMPTGIYGTSQNIKYMFHGNYNYYIIVKMNKEWKDTVLHELSHIILKHCTFSNLRKKLDMRTYNKQERDAEHMALMWYKKIKSKL